MIVVTALTRAWLAASLLCHRGNEHLRADRTEEGTDLNELV